MKTIALRFSNNFAPECGTIAAHQEIITRNGYVWYGKLGTPVSNITQKDILINEHPRILLIHSGGPDRYWAYVEAIQRDVPGCEGIPSYYQMMREKFHTWFKVIRFEKAPVDIMSHCFVASSGATLSNASRHSVSPYFIINCND